MSRDTAVSLTYASEALSDFLFRLGQNFKAKNEKASASIESAQAHLLVDASVLGDFPPALAQTTQSKYWRVRKVKNFISNFNLFFRANFAERSTAAANLFLRGVQVPHAISAAVDQCASSAGEFARENKFEVSNVFDRPNCSTNEKVFRTPISC